MRRAIAALAMSLSLAGCGGGTGTEARSSISAPLKIDEAVSPDMCCVLSYSVMDVVADPELGTVEKVSRRPLWWPRGFAARWVGSEIEVLDATGLVVLTTGSRYYVLWAADPGYTLDVVGEVRLCRECELGGGPL